MSWTTRKEVRSAIIGKCYAQVRRMAVPGMSRRVYFWAVVSKRGAVKKQGSVAKKKAGDRRTYYQIAMEEAEKCALSLSGKRKNPSSGFYSMGKSKPRKDLSNALKEMKKNREIRAKNHGDFQSAMVSAAYYAMKRDEAMYVYGGNSYMTKLYRVSSDSSKYLSRIDNTDGFVIKVTPSLAVTYIELNRKNPAFSATYWTPSERMKAARAARAAIEKTAKGGIRPSARKNAAKMVKVFDGDYEGMIEVPANSYRYSPRVVYGKDGEPIRATAKRVLAKNMPRFEESYDKEWRAKRAAQRYIDDESGGYPTTGGGDPRTNAGFARVRRIMMGQVPSIKTVGILTAENPQAKQLSAKQNRVRNQRLVRGLREMGYGPIPLKGMYGIKETSYLVPNITRKDTTGAGKAFDQESVIWASRKRTGRNAYMNWQFITGDKTIQTRDLSMSGRDIQGRKDFFSEKKGRKFAIPFFDERFEPRKFHRERIAQLKRMAAKRKNPTRASYKPMLKVVGERSNPGLTMSEIKLAIKAEKAAVKKIDQKMKKR